MEAVVKTLALTTVGWSERLEWLWKTLCNEFFYGCHFLSLSASGIVLATMLFLQIPIRWELCILAYLLTQTAYMYNHYREFTEDSQVESKRVQHLRLYGRFFPALVFVYGFTFVSILLVFGSLQ